MKDATNQRPVIIESEGMLYSVRPKQPFCPLKNYSEEELALMVKSDPSFMATDTKFYNPAYARAMCEIYTTIVEGSAIPLKRINHFKIADLEKAILKLSKEQHDNYYLLCQRYGIQVATGKCKKSNPRVDARAAILQLSSWGYVEQYFPNLQATISKVAKKMYSRYIISDIDKAKYAHAYFVFIDTGNIMPYDVQRYSELLETATKNNQKISTAERESLFYQALAEMQKEEHNAVYEAVMLQNAYDAFFAALPDDSLSVDMIHYFIFNILKESERMRILEFLDLLIGKEVQEFKKSGLKPLNYNSEIRALKEEIFSAGIWWTDSKLFSCNNSEKFNKAVCYAYKRFAENDFEFGKNVKPYKKPYSYRQASSGKPYTQKGYLYASSPLTVRISDVNELRLMHFYLTELNCN